MTGRRAYLAIAALLSLCLWVVLSSHGQESAAKPAATPATAAPASDANAPFNLHDFHSKQVGLDCDACHVSDKAGSVSYKRPGHDQCTTCHQDDFEKDIKEKICMQCHTTFPPTSPDELLPFPRYKDQRPIVFEFSHAKHIDPHARVDTRTGFRSDCTFCHKFPADGTYANFGDHVVCASCHAKAGMKPLLSEKSTTVDCRGCHRPEEIENPGAATVHRVLASYVVSGKYEHIKFSHAQHFKAQDAYHLDCTTCHYGITSSTSLASMTLPKMADCVSCHDVSKTIAAEYRMSNCASCHAEPKMGPIPEAHTRIVKPVSHTDGFRVHHADEASKPGAPCFVCHMNVAATSNAAQECAECHQTMKPASHTARWKDDVHGKVASFDRATCATCHTTNFCSRCHNETPRSHFPLAQFKAGGHAQLAILNERSCLTCHTFADTCEECHAKNLK
jgi:hypothetical protein